jgi:hypothetical protein
MAHTTSNPKIHEGRNLKRFREMMSVKQDALAFRIRARRRLEPAKNLPARTEGKDRFRHFGAGCRYFENPC